MRVEQLLFEQMRAHLLQPLRLDVGQPPAKQTGGLDQLGSNQPATRLFTQMRPRMSIKLDASRAKVGLVVLELAANVAQQACQHGQVQLLIAGRQRVQAPFVFGHHCVQLGVGVAPFAHATHVDEVLTQQGFVLAVAEFVGVVFATARAVEPFPQGQVAAEFAAIVVKLGMRLIGGGLRFHGTVSHILHAQGGGNDQHLVQRLSIPRLQNHAAHARIQGQFGQGLADWCEFMGVVHRAKFTQQLVAVGNGFGAWRF